MQDTRPPLNEFLLLGGALAAGFALGMLVVALRRRPAERVQHEVLAEVDPATAAPTLKAGAPEGWDESFSVAEPAAPRVAPLQPPSPPAPSPRAPPAPPADPDARWRRPSSLGGESSPPPRPADEPGGVPSEWARRQVGAVEPGRSKGVCSGCGTMLSISDKRPLRIACPVCGRTRLLA